MTRITGLKEKYDLMLRKISDKNWLIIRAVIFPIGILAPFLLTRQKHPFCVPLHYTGHGMYQQGGGYPNTGSIYGLLSGLLVILFSIVAFQATRPREHNARIRFIKLQVVISVLSILITLPIYFIMRRYSQAVIGYPWGFDSQCHMIGHWQQATFGFGLAPILVIGLAVLYLIVPLGALYRWHISKSHVGDVKKKELFQ